MPSAVIVLRRVAPAKSPKKRAKSQRKKSGPTVSDLILKAVSASTERSGMSLAAVKKALKAGGYDVGKNNARVLITIRRLVANKALVQTKGIGSSGSFKLNKKAPAPPKKKVVSKTKPKAKKVLTRTSVKKSPRKAKKPAAAKSPKKPKSPRRAKRRVVKSTRTRAAAKKRTLCH
ncbi:histone H1-like [Hippoglossus stenolepis]|uniref:histone H1-like n=1 Tax=Hippoglossus stenolepis TaxID=195615 RepID=UPI00159C48C6|nr:histone H1-like [Hippoglossus stenolepis]XP_035022349.1 histone H1-like [Hippoglossus stenolepis]